MPLRRGPLLDPSHAPPPVLQPGALSRPSFGGYPARIARDGVDGITYAIIPSPTYPTPARTLQKRDDAIATTYTGRWEEAVDLYRQTVEADLFFDGILKTIAHGVLSLDVSFQGDPAQCSALLNADGTPGDFATMHPEEECAKIFTDGLGLGIGLGQYLLTCWRCGYTDMDRVVLTQGGAAPVEVCKRCDAARIDRPAGKRVIYALQWRDPRWLWQNPVNFGWYYTGRTGLVPIVDGDGEWMIFRTVPGLEPWRHGPWIGATLAAIFSRDAQYDAQNTSSVCAPTPVLIANKPTGSEARRQAEAKMERLAFDNRIVLDGEWDYKIVSASADYSDICEAIVSRCSDGFETALTGNVMGRKAAAAFTDGKFTNRVTRERRGFYAGAWARQIREKGLRWYSRENFGTDNAPVLGYDVRSPEDKLAASTALSAEGAALKAMREGADAVGVELDPAWVIERLQRIGVRARPKAVAQQVAALDLGVEQVGAVVRGGVALASLGLQPFGDERDDMTIAQLTNIADGSAPPVPPSAPPNPSQPPVSAAAPEPDEEPEQDDGAAARLADDMNAHGIAACRHRRTSACPTCGVRASYRVQPGAGGEPHTFKATWAAIAAQRVPA